MLDLPQLRLRCTQGEQFSYLFFWGHQPAKDGTIKNSCLSQWFVAPFEIEGVTYPTAEHWMMASKARLFGDDESLRQIITAPDPRAAKALGRTVKNFSENEWKSNCVRLVIAGNLAKFDQNIRLREFLIGTKDQVLVEASPDDSVWGIGLQATDPRAQQPETWQGQNLLGFALMDVRGMVGK